MDGVERKTHGLETNSGLGSVAVLVGQSVRDKENARYPGEMIANLGLGMIKVSGAINGRSADK
jgi:hypothetical protein